jgi:hypothetical protein
MNNKDATETIRSLNDAFRKTGAGGHQMITPGIQEMGLVAVAQLRRTIAKYCAFSEDNDPHHEHDFGSITFLKQTVFWKIDYYDKPLTGGSSDPSDPSITTRVLTVMLAHEY